MVEGDQGLRCQGGIAIRLQPISPCFVILHNNAENARMKGPFPDLIFFVALRPLSR
jgi:hypothetical protein